MSGFRILRDSIYEDKASERSASDITNSVSRINQGICYVGVTTTTTTTVVVVLGLFFRKKSVVVVFRGSGCSGFSSGFGPQAESGKFSGFGVVVLN